ncbi:hypothetical protein Tco_1540993 [Tanacetum coccineum]
MGNVKKYVAERTRHQRQYDKRVNKRQMQTQESKFDTNKALDVGLVVTESSGTELEAQDESSRSRNDTDANDTDIRPIYDDEPMAEVQLTTECNIFATRQHHTEQTELNNDRGVNEYTEKCQVHHIMSARKTLSVVAEKANISETSVTVDSQMMKQKHDPRTTTSIEVPTADMTVMTSMIELESLFGPLFDEYFNGENQVVLKSSAITTADASDKRQQQPDSNSSTSTLATTVTVDGNFDL